MYAENELLFPSHVIPKLRESRGEDWAKLVDHVSRVPEHHPESLAFSLMMIRMDGCMACETDSYRAMKGCLVRRYKGSDQELLQRYQEASVEIEEHLESLPTEPIFIAARAA